MNIYIWFALDFGYWVGNVFAGLRNKVDFNDFDLRYVEQILLYRFPWF